MSHILLSHFHTHHPYYVIGNDVDGISVSSGFYQRPKSTRKTPFDSIEAILDSIWFDWLFENLKSIRFNSIQVTFDSIWFGIVPKIYNSESIRFDETYIRFDSIRFRSLARIYWGRAKFIFVIYLINCSVICNYFRHNFLALYDIPPWLSKESSTHLIFILFLTMQKTVIHLHAFIFFIYLTKNDWISKYIF